MTGKLIVIGVLLALSACASRQDRQWSDMQTVMERTLTKR